MAAITLEGVSKRYGPVIALDEIDIAIPDRALTVVVGPSGCGKSTLLKVIAGLEEADSGQVAIGGERIDHLPPARRNVAMVFQAYALYPHMTAAENMAFPLRMAGLGRAAIATQVRAVAETLRIADLLDRKPAALSGGQQQRVAIGRALVRDPAATLLDEPLSNLDAQLRADMRAEIAGLQKQLGATMVLVTHDQIEAMTLAERIVVLNHGRVAQTGGPLDLYHRPANRFVAGFIGAPQMNFLDCRITALGADGIAVALAGDLTLTIPADPGAARVGVAATLGIRPEHLALGETSDPSLVCAVTRVERLGASAHITVDSAAGPLRVAIAGEPSLKEGESLALGLAPARCHLFDADGIALASRTL